MDKVAELALEEYKETGVNIFPLFPAVLVRVFPKPLETRSGLIILPDSSKDGNHTTVREGVVIRPYSPRKTVWKGKEILLDSGLTAGDHVCFPHWVGEPVKGLDDEDYRLIPARGILSNTGEQDAGEILGVITRAKKLDAAQIQLLMIQAATDVNIASNVEKFLERYEVIEKITTSSLKK